MKKIIIEFIPREQQRYDSTGDYFLDNEGNLQVKISDKTKYNPLTFKEQLLVMFHELVEYFLCLDRGIKEEDITKYDMEYKGKIPDRVGEDVDAIYHKEHMFALWIEKLICRELNIDFIEYDKKFDKEVKNEIL